MTSPRKRKHILYTRLASLPLGLIAMSDTMEAHARETEQALGLPFGRARSSFILKGGKPLSVPYWKQNLWLREKTGRRDRPTLTIARSRAGRWTVSTVFLGLDHGMPFSGAPVLFETMAYERRADGKGIFRNEQYRYRTWDEAIRGHRQFTVRLSTLRAVPA